jgi:hypothetical protein
MHFFHCMVRNVSMVYTSIIKIFYHGKCYCLLHKYRGYSSSGHSWGLILALIIVSYNILSVTVIWLRSHTTHLVTWNIQQRKILTKPRMMSSCSLFILKFCTSCYPFQIWVMKFITKPSSYNKNETHEIYGDLFFFCYIQKSGRGNYAMAWLMQWSTELLVLSWWSWRLCNTDSPWILPVLS